MRTTTATNFRANIKKYFDAIIKDRQELVVSRGDTGIVMMSLDDYNAMVETEYLASSKEMAQTIIEGLKDVDSGNYEEIDVDAL